MVNLKSRSILVITNHPLSALRMRVGLRALPNCHVSFAFDRADAHQLASRVYPDLLIIDCRIFCTNGVTLVEEFRRLCPDTMIIVLVGENSDEDRRYAAGLSVHRILEKPVSFTELYQVALSVLTGVTEQ
jgi:CheY-like chemotaxis protein